MIVDPLEMQLKLRKFSEDVSKMHRVMQESDIFGQAIRNMRANPEFIAAYNRLIEANAVYRKSRALRKVEPKLEFKLRRAFIAQGNDFLKQFARLQSKFTTEALREVAAADWEPLFDDAVLATLKAFVKPIDEFTARAMASGMISAVADLSVETSFTLEHPAAVRYLKDHGVDQMKHITDTTREGLRSILTQASENGWSYNKTAREIRQRYADFSKTRAKNIAVYELGAAYEEGGLVVARDLADAGLTMQKKWLSVRDERTRPEHRANDDQGWIDLEATFQSGHDHPPTDPKCRCASQLRRQPTSEQ